MLGRLFPSGENRNLCWGDFPHLGKTGIYAGETFPTWGKPEFTLWRPSPSGESQNLRWGDLPQVGKARIYAGETFPKWGKPYFLTLPLFFKFGRKDSIINVYQPVFGMRRKDSILKNQ
jgi:hypothetical protein